MAEGAQIQLHIPDGINYECTGCGKCCGGWAVPMTASDYERVSKIDWGSLLPRLSGKQLYRRLKGYEREGTPYTHAIKEAENGFCPFLENNLCFIHSKFAPETKPSMCQLFPYCFNETPSGIYTTVSFVSMAVVYNTGKPLAEQRDYLQKKLVDFQNLYPNHHPNWSKLELTGGQSISWDEYLSLEEEVLSILKERHIPMEERFRDASRKLVARHKGANVQSGALSEDQRKADAESNSSSLNSLDKHLLMTLHGMYFPNKILARGEYDFKVSRFLTQIIFKGLNAPLRLALTGQTLTLEELADVEWPDADPEIEDLIYRYFFSRIFAKLYFGAGFGQLTLIAGFHHLAILYALLKMQSKGLAHLRDVKKVSYVDVVQAVRQLEKRLGETKVDGYGAALLELLMFSPARIDRILSAA